MQHLIRRLGFLKSEFGDAMLVHIVLVSLVITSSVKARLWPPRKNVCVLMLMIVASEQIERLLTSCSM